MTWSFRFNDIKKEGLDKQILFPTGINVATENVGGLGTRLAHKGTTTGLRNW